MRWAFFRTGKPRNPGPHIPYQPTTRQSKKGSKREGGYQVSRPTFSHTDTHCPLSLLPITQGQRTLLAFNTILPNSLASFLFHENLGVPYALKPARWKCPVEAKLLQAAAGHWAWPAAHLQEEFHQVQVIGLLPAVELQQAVDTGFQEQSIIHGIQTNAWLLGDRKQAVSLWPRLIPRTWHSEHLNRLYVPASLWPVSMPTAAFPRVYLTF